jgi:AmmeMemoRadiSam system protein A
MDGKVLIDIAKRAIAEEFEGKKEIDREALLAKYPELGEPGAVFVTLRENSSLRGCIGSIVAHRPLIDDLIHNARAAAFSDPRFSPLQPYEFPLVDIEISLLTPPERVEYADREDLKRIVVPGVDGIIIRKGAYQATYLPSVWEELPDFESFFSTLCRKAGMASNCIDDHPEVYRYRAKKIVGDDG